MITIIEVFVSSFTAKIKLVCYNDKRSDNIVEIVVPTAISTSLLKRICYVHKKKCPFNNKDCNHFEEQV